ncbi:hypothetical protein DCF38_08875 [Edwardsiella piscicida]|uniref:hypothetical protein n=1 Tax=Edwardsiella piscicida TaxID=1263550 RepID=UPI001A9C9793|nr:hypothetical protein [Edwardsiella piscicida]UCQ39653.1 hypothetical protein DCF38_08875 [Edwardsiella piscicida]
MMNKTDIYDSALAVFGHDRQLLNTATECNGLAASCTRFITHQINASRVADEAANVEIMIEQLRHNGMDGMIEHSKARALSRLAQRVAHGAPAAAHSTPFVASLLKDAMEQFEEAEALYLDSGTSNRLAAAGLRRSIALMMQAAQLMVREQQRKEAGENEKEVGYAG